MEPNSNIMQQWPEFRVKPQQGLLQVQKPYKTPVEKPADTHITVIVQNINYLQFATIKLKKVMPHTVVENADNHWYSEK